MDVSLVLLADKASCNSCCQGRRSTSLKGMIDFVNPDWAIQLAQWFVLEPMGKQAAKYFTWACSWMRSRAYPMRLRLRSIKDALTWPQQAPFPSPASSCSIRGFRRPDLSSRVSRCRIYHTILSLSLSSDLDGAMMVFSLIWCLPNGEDNINPFKSKSLSTSHSASFIFRLLFRPLRLFSSVVHWFLCRIFHCGLLLYFLFYNDLLFHGFLEHCYVMEYIEMFCTSDVYR